MGAAISSSKGGVPRKEAGLEQSPQSGSTVAVGKGAWAKPKQGAAWRGPPTITCPSTYTVTQWIHSVIQLLH